MKMIFKVLTPLMLICASVGVISWAVISEINSDKQPDYTFEVFANSRDNHPIWQDVVDQVNSKINESNLSTKNKAKAREELKKAHFHLHFGEMKIFKFFNQDELNSNQEIWIGIIVQKALTTS